MHTPQLNGEIGANKLHAKFEQRVLFQPSDRAILIGFMTQNMIASSISLGTALKISTR